MKPDSTPPTQHINVRYQSQIRAIPLAIRSRDLCQDIVQTLTLLSQSIHRGSPPGGRQMKKITPVFVTKSHTLKHFQSNNNGKLKIKD